MVDDRPAMQLAVGGERRDAVIAAREGDLPERRRGGRALPADRPGRHVDQLEPTGRGREVAFVADGGVDALAGAGQRLAVMDLPPAPQALAVGLELRVHRPDLLGAGTVDEDHRDIAEDQAGGGHGGIGRALEGREGLQEGEGGAVVGVGAHLTGSADDEERLRGGREQDLVDRGGVGRHDERCGDGDLALAAQALAFGQADGGQQRLAALLLADQQEARLRTFRIPDIETRQASAADGDRLEGRHDGLDGALTGVVEGRTIDHADLLDRAIRKPQEDQTRARVTAYRGHAPLAEHGCPLQQHLPVLGPLEEDASVATNDEGKLAILVFAESDRLRRDGKRRLRRDLGSHEKREHLEDQEAQHAEHRDDHADAADADEASHPTIGRQGQRADREARLGRGRGHFVGCRHRVTIGCQGFRQRERRG